MPPRLNLVVLALLAAGRVAGASSPTPPPAPCVESFEVRHGNSVLAEQRNKGADWPDFPERYAGALIDPARHSPVGAVKSHQVRGRPILWFEPDASRAVVDRDVLSDVTVVHLPRLGEGGAPVPVTRIAQAARKELSPREWLRFLTASGALQAYAHTEATLCLESERETKDGYEAIVSGRHVFYTNERNEAGYRFAFRIDGSGAVTVAGLASR